MTRGSLHPQKRKAGVGISVLFRVDREEGKPTHFPPLPSQPHLPAAPLRGLSLDSQIWAKYPTGLPSDLALQVGLSGELTEPGGFHNERSGWMKGVLANTSWLACRLPPFFP